MDSPSIVYPVIAQVFLTFSVWTVLLFGRVGILIRGKINPQKVADEAQAQKIYKDLTNISDNLENLFEMPVLFYAIAIFLLATERVDPIYLGTAWGFVFFRAVHSLIHCTYNKIRHRFFAYLISSALLWAMWIRLAVQLLK